MAKIKRNRGNYAASHWHVAKLPIAGLSTPRDDSNVFTGFLHEAGLELSG